MVYINSRGEVIDDSRASPVNIFWKIVNFIILFFKSLIGIEDKPDKKNDSNIGGSGPVSGGFYGGGGGGKPNGSGGPSNSNGNRKFGPRGFKSITDLSPPPTPMMGCSGGGCG